MKIDTDTVKHVALLSRLRLSDKELELYSRQLAAILTYIKKLDELNTADTPPTSHVLSDLRNVDRKDEVRPSLPVEDVLANAPEREEDFFRIPKVIEGK
ncbi:MAG: Asp-tRNA(Asn)/Glu-tRNA(Gln) amidotransferase subunit GatC [Candidatus Omnitrophota bacterium]